MVVMTHFSAAQPAEIALGFIRAGLAIRIGLLVVDAGLIRRWRGYGRWGLAEACHRHAFGTAFTRGPTGTGNLGNRRVLAGRADLWRLRQHTALFDIPPYIRFTSDRQIRGPMVEYAFY